MKYKRFIQNLLKKKNKYNNEILPDINDMKYSVIYCNNYLDLLFNTSRKRNNDIDIKFKNISIPNITKIDINTYAENGNNTEEDVINNIINNLIKYDYINYLPILSNIVIKISSKNNYNKLCLDTLSIFPKVYMEPSSNSVYIKLNLSYFKYILNINNIPNFYKNLIIFIIDNYTDMKYINKEYYDNYSEDYELIQYNIPITEPSIFNFKKIKYLETSIFYLGIDPIIENESLLYLRNIYLYTEDNNIINIINYDLYNKDSFSILSPFITISLETLYLLYKENNDIVIELLNNKNICELVDLLIIFENMIQSDNDINYKSIDEIVN